MEAPSDVRDAAVLLEGSVRANLERPFRYKSVGVLSAKEMGALCERLALRPAVLEQPARTLSVGEQQRIALIRALVIRPDVLLLDEPTSALDVDSVASVEQLIRERARESGLAALIVSHDPEQVRRLTERQLDLRRLRKPKPFAMRSASPSRRKLT